MPTRGATGDPTCASPASTHTGRADRGSSTFEFDIAPGHPEQSILIYRMNSTDPGEMMPELGRQRVDTRAIALMRDWIAGMNPDGSSR